MGMYTEIVIKADVKPDLPDTVERVLQYMFNDYDYPAGLPQHPFFQCSQWDMVGKCSSFSHTPWADSKYWKGYLFSRSDLKNYSDEIDLFIDWIKPYLDEIEGKCIGWRWYEEYDVPTLILM